VLCDVEVSIEGTIEVLHVLMELHFVWNKPILLGMNHIMENMAVTFVGRNNPGNWSHNGTLFHSGEIIWHNLTTGVSPLAAHIVPIP